MHREDIKNAEYNPRTITDQARENLKGILEENGLIEALTWNARSGNLVGGHQRLAILDALSKTKKDYTLTVNVVDMDDAAEHQANVALNNPTAQGDYDLEKLGAMYRTGKLTLRATGMQAADMYQLFGLGKTLAATPGATEQLSQKIADTAKKYEEVLHVAHARGDDSVESTEFYLVLVFRTPEDVGTFITENGLPDDRFQNGDAVRELLKKAKR